MKKIALLALLLVTYLVPNFASAQEVTYVEDPSQGYLFNRMKDNWFITADGGVGMMMSGNKSLKDADTLDNLPQNEEHHYIVDGKTSQKSFEGLTDTGTHVGIAGRLGLMFDYRFSQKMSAGLELITTVTDDKFEGIKYDEPFDILIKLSGGVKYYF